MTTLLDFNRICRTCMTYDGQMTDIFNQTLNVNQISTMLSTFTTLQVSEDDGLPPQICLDCLTLVNKLYVFKQQCERSDSVLRDYAGQSCNNLLNKQSNDNKEINLSEELQQLTNFTTGIIEPKVEILDSFNNGETVVDPLQWFPDSLLHNLTEDLLEKLLNNLKTKWFEIQTTSSNDDYFMDDIKKEEDSEEEITVRKTRSKKKQHVRKRKHSTIRSNLEPATKEKRRESTSALCSLCGKSFATARVLKRHQLIHTGEYPYECETCGKRFRQLENLRAHISIHTGERAYLCMTCGQNFRTQSGLCTHQRIHRKEKKFTCKICGAKMNAHLARHMLTHSSEKPHSCDLCDKRFANREKLNLHKSVHSDVRKHVCDICQKGFKRRDNLKQHIRIHTGEKPYVCLTCGRAFSQAHCLVSHRKVHPSSLGSDENDDYILGKRNDKVTDDLLKEQLFY